jgi:hypothetical protein
MKKDYSLDFEHCVRQFLGDKAYHIADSVGNDSSVRSWYRKCINKMEKRVDLLDSTARHKEMLMKELNDLDERLKLKKSLGSKELVIDLFWLISRLFGYDAISGKVYNQAFYHQTYGQYFMELASWKRAGKSWGEINVEEIKNVITWRKAIVRLLKEKGLDENIIAQILNTTEYQIKKMKHNL